MLSVRGIYENGQINLLEPIPYQRRVNVIITVLEEMTNQERSSEMDINTFDELIGAINLRKDGSEAHDRYLSETV